MAKPSKKPAAGERVRTKKQPHIEAEPSYNQHVLSWHVSLMETVDPFGWHAVDRDKAVQILQKLGNFETQTWNNLIIEGKKNNHSVLIEDLCKAARDRLTQLNQDDIEALVSLHLSGKERIWGIRDKYIFKILWWDPDHQVCPSPKKHT